MKLNKTYRVLGKRTLVCLLFVVLGSLIYANTLDSPFVFDDVPNITENKALRVTELSFGQMARAAFESYDPKRPVANLSFALNYYFHQYDVTGYHIVNIAVHILCGIFLYLLITVTIKVNADSEQSSSARWIALFASLIWFVHPIQTQSVTYIVQRMNSLSAMFYILSLLLYVRGRLSIDHKVWLYAGCALSGTLALGSKAIAAPLPFFILLYEWYFFQDLSWNWIKRRLPFVFAAMVLLWLFASYYLGANPFEGITSYYRRYLLGFTITERVLTQLRVVTFYISLLLFPLPSRLNLDHDFTLSRSLVDPVTTLLAMGVIIGLLVSAVLTAKKERLVSFCILWFFGNLVIESSVIGMEIIYEHRNYLPSMFFFLPFLLLGQRYLKSRRAAAGVLSALLVLLCFWTYQRNNVWADPISLWKDSAGKSPNKARPHYNLGNFLAKRGRLEESVDSYRAALGVRPHDARTHFNLANTMLRRGQLQEAKEHYQKALRSKPDYPQAETGLGVVLARQGKLEEAIVHYERALAMQPDNPVTLNNLGYALARQGNLADAEGRYRAALRIRPDYPEARQNLKVLLAMRHKPDGFTAPHDQTLRSPSVEVQKLLDKGVKLAREGRLEEAKKVFSEALRVEPEYAEAHYNMALALARQGRLEEAVGHYRKAIRTKPGYAEAHNNLGIALAGQGMLKEAAGHFSKAIQIRPDFEEAETNLKRARERLAGP